MSFMRRAENVLNARMISDNPCRVGAGFKPARGAVVGRDPVRAGFKPAPCT